MATKMGLLNGFMHGCLFFHIQVALSLVNSPLERKGRYLVVPAAREEIYPSLVLLGGIAQTVTSWEHQIPSLSRNRKVLVYQCIGQGNSNGDSSGETNIYSNVTLPFQAERLLETLDEALGDTDVVDIAGFSFGGRVGMAAASLQPSRIRRLHLTGVACDRSDYGHLAMESFKDIIKSDSSLQSFAWSILLATYSETFLRAIPRETRERFLNHIRSNNTPEGLLAILEQAEITDESDPWHVASMADRLDSKLPIKLCVGELDKMAPIDQVKLLGHKVGCHSIDIMPGCGHAVAVEGARGWKDSVLTFLDKN